MTKRAVRKSSKSIEEDIGIKWFLILGIIALVIGVGFFIKYAIDNNWINHLTRIVIGVVFGVVLITLGEFLKRKENIAPWAKTLVAGGIAIVYFAIYSAYHFQEYRNAIGITLLVDIVLLSIVVIFSIVLSIKDNSKIITAGSFFLGYLTSMLSGEFQVLSVVYVMILSIGLIYVVMKEKWFLFSFGGLFLAYLLYINWHVLNVNNFLLSTFFLTTYFIVFNIPGFFYFDKKNSMEIEKSLLIVLNTLFYSGFMRYIILENYPGYEYIISLVLAIFFLVAYYFCRSHKFILINDVLIYSSLFFVTISVLEIFTHSILTVVLAFETLILTVIGYKSNNLSVKISSYIIGVITLVRVLSTESLAQNAFSFANLFQSTRLFTFLIVIMISYFLAYYTNNANKKSKGTSVSAAYFCAGTFLLLVLIILESEKLWTNVLLLLQALLTFIILRRRVQLVNYVVLFLCGVITLKLLFYDFYALNPFALTNILASTRAIASILTIILFYYLAYNSLENKRSNIFSQVYSWTASIIIVLFLLIELEKFWISVSWIIVSIILLSFGFLMNRRVLRHQGIVIMFLAIIKVFLYDTQELSTLGRTVSFIVLGVILLVASFLYYRYKDKIRNVL